MLRRYLRVLSLVVYLGFLSGISFVMDVGGRGLVGERGVSWEEGSMLLGLSCRYIVFWEFLCWLCVV